MRSDDVSSVRSSEIEPQDSADKKCAPAQQFEDGSCMPVDVMIELAKAYNTSCQEGELKGKQIRLHPKLDALNPGKYKRYLVREFQNRLDNVCDNQQCWVKHKFTKQLGREMKHYLTKYTFRPKGPSGRFEWLNTFNIQDGMKQYEAKYPDFKFLGAVPMDFDDLPALGVSNLDFEQVQRGGKHRLGVVFNLDEHYKSGSHWVAGYYDLNQGQVYFFDSYGVRPEPRVRKLMRRVARYCKEKGLKLDVRYNTHRHQYKNTECGVYSMNFIIRMLNGEGFDQITKNKTSDAEINKCRKVYFH